MLNSEQLETWDRDGFVVLPGFVSKQRCAELKAHVEGLLADIDPDNEGAISVFSTTEQSHAQDEWFLGSGDTVRWFF